MQKHKLLGKTIDGRYELPKVLGSGHWHGLQARQTDCDRIVAIKLLHKQYSDDAELSSRFLRDGVKIVS